MAYPKLFERGRIGGLTLKNRVFMPPMGTNIVDATCFVNDAIVGYYEARAKGGCGLIITEISRIDEGAGRGMMGQLSVTGPQFVSGLYRLTNAVHKYDAKIFLQLQHPGREASSRSLGGLQSVGPSPIACKTVGEIPHELTIAECEDLVRKFVTGAVYAKMAGFDGVELHAAHGYLLNEFLSPYSNKRTDKYGGSFEGRLQFIKEIILGIKAQCGKRFPVSVRLSADEYLGEEGITIEEGVRIAQALEAIGIDAIDVSAGVYETGYATIEPQQLPVGFKRHVAEAVKKAVRIPVLAVNNIKDPADAERFLEEGVCDFAGIGRGHIADPAWANKAKEDRAVEIRKCLGCMECFKCYAKLRPLECTVNPVVGQEYLYNEKTLEKCEGARTVCVVGAGPAGMQAAAVLAQRGYDTHLFDRLAVPGGTVRLASLPPHKEMLAELIKTQARELELAGVTLHLGCDATPEALEAYHPYGVVLATGGSPVVPKLPGADGPNVCTAEDYLEGRVQITGKKVAVIGGGVTGLETSELLAKDNRVTVVEMLSKIGGDLYATPKVFLRRSIDALGVAVRTSERVTAIENGRVRLQNVDTGAESFVEADCVVLAMGVKNDPEANEKWFAAFDHVVAVGDAAKPAQIMDAMQSAHDKAWVF